MELTLYFDEKDKIVVAIPEGNVTKDNVILTTSKAIELLNKHNSNLLLFDITKCPIKQSIADAFELMSSADKSLGLTFKYRTAVIYNNELFPDERAKFIENIVFNRGNNNFKMFTDKEEAISWLIQTK